MLRLASVALVFLTILPLMGRIEQPVRADDNVPLVRSNVIMIVQGENDVTVGKEAKDDFYALKIVSFELPHNSSRVYTTVPQIAREISVWTQIASLNMSLYGRETSGDMAGEFFIDVPSSHSRNSKFTNTTDNESAFEAPGSVFENASYSSGALQLTSGSDQGSFISADMPVNSSFSILSGNLTLSGDLLENVTSYLSNDGGVTWTQCDNGTEFNFTSSGNVLKLRLVMDGNETLGLLPNVTSFKVVASFVQIKTVFVAHISYLWTQDFPGRQASIDLSESMPYTSSGSFLVMLYALKGYVPQGVGFEFTKDETGSMNTYPDKDLYLFSASSLPSGGNISFVMTAPKPDYSWVLYVVGGVAAVVLLGSILFVRSRRSRAEISSNTDEETGQAPVDLDKDARRKELVERKKSILAKMDGLKGKGTSSELKDLKRELKQVRNDLNKLPKATIVASSEGEKSGPPVPIQDPYEAMLASISRLDDDFERGRLPESTYQSLRKEYVSKAASMMESRKAAKTEEPLVGEKIKLMEAILALDDEHDKGEIDEKVYGELRASYRKELAGITRKLEERS